ncbi:hypothetical protein HK104_001316 [Borealophlyctis nickersoniae]|nr:hypothetical protein HK104_001316 [Borealophlyctis nickersoniae]
MTPRADSISFAGGGGALGGIGGVGGGHAANGPSTMTTTSTSPLGRRYFCDAMNSNGTAAASAAPAPKRMRNRNLNKLTINVASNADTKRVSVELWTVVVKKDLRGKPVDGMGTFDVWAGRHNQPKRELEREGAASLMTTWTAMRLQT